MDGRRRRCGDGVIRDEAEVELVREGGGYTTLEVITRAVHLMEHLADLARGAEADRSG